jgi:NADH-quinone oxidoreductase subunit J
MSPLFVVAALLSIAGGLGVVLAKQPVHQVLATVLNFIGLAVLYMSLQSEFISVIQIVVYGGAVMVLFLFVIALLTARKDPMEREASKLSGQAIASYAIGGAVLLMLALVGVVGKSTGGFAAVAPTYGTTKQFGMELLTTHVLPFEVLSFILLVAVIGVVILVGRQQQS